jgi:hypothetical protein
MRIVYDDGVVAIDFLSRKVRNTTPRPLKPLDFHDPLGRSIADFVRAASGGEMTLVRPAEARLALQTALQIEDAAGDVSAPRDLQGLVAAAG